MEHLLLPKDPTSAELPVPCVCEPPYYDGQDFILYPLRHAKPWLVCKDGKDLREQIDAHEGYEPTPIGELESFYQQWLFFGLLKVVLQTAFRAEDFVSEKAGKRFITTGGLMPRLQQIWTLRPFARAVSATAQLYTNKCMSIVTTVLGSIKIPRLHSTERRFDWRIRLAIASLGQLVASAANFAFDMQDLKLEQKAVQPPEYLFPNEDVVIEMRRAGWCPSELYAITNKFSSLQSRYFLSRIKKPEPHKVHDQCNTRFCQWNQTKPRTYVTKHRDQQCSCLDYNDADLAITVRHILNEGGLPLIKITEDGPSLRVQAIRSTTDTKYIAFSHVWVDGLGNPLSNSLPICQLVNLRKVAVALQSKAFASRNLGSSLKEDCSSFAANSHVELEESLIWIDTLCCPSEESQAKSTSILQLRETYSNAALVLVLDATLQTITLETTSFHEVLLRVFSSSWTSRLWTSQEGVLAKSLWFQFHDQAEDFAVLKNGLFLEGYEDVRAMIIYHDLVNQFQWLGIYNPEDPANPKIGQELLTLDYALSRRAVSVPADEALCITTLLDLNLREIVAVPAEHEARMCKLWELIAKKYGGIPQSILTLGYTRLETEGFRWAPKTLLDEGVAYRGGQRIVYWSDPVLGQPDKNGLLVKCSGYIISNRHWDDGLLQNPWQSLGLVNTNFPLMTFRDGESAERYGFSVRPYNRDIPLQMSNSKNTVYGTVHELVDSGPCGILQVMNSAKDKTAEALMGRIKTLSSGICQIHRPVLVLLWRLDTSMTLVFDTVEQIATAARSILPTRRMDELQRQDQQNSKEMEAAVKDMKSFVKALTEEKLRDRDVTAAMNLSLKTTDMACLAGLVLDFFWHDYVAQGYDASQAWYID
ncbi:hypothetical protein MMC26_007167 [Xylographa opegraphella]|nr:hypothetical protein [Xylographa opegraphella]